MKPAADRRQLQEDNLFVASFLAARRAVGVARYSGFGFAIAALQRWLCIGRDDVQCRLSAGQLRKRRCCVVEQHRLQERLVRWNELEISCVHATSCANIITLKGQLMLTYRRRKRQVFETKSYLSSSLSALANAARAGCSPNTWACTLHAVQRGTALSAQLLSVKIGIAGTPHRQAHALQCIHSLSSDGRLIAHAVSSIVAGMLAVRHASCAMSSIWIPERLTGADLRSPA